jgi:hypothetical protein
MPTPWINLAAVILLVAPQEATQPWPPKGAPEMETVFRVVYKEKGHPYVDETYRVDMAALRQLWEQSQGKASPLELIRSGQVWSSVRMRFLVDIGGPKRRSLVERNLREVWGGSDYPADSPEILAYLDWQGQELNYGDLVEYCFSPGKAMDIRFNEGRSKRFTSPKLIQALRTIEYTDDPADPGTMADFESALLKRLR